jgi:hypothetical protein
MEHGNGAPDTHLHTLIPLAPRYAALLIYTLNVSRALLGVEHEPLPGASPAKRVLYRHDRERPGERQGGGTSGSLHAGERAASVGTVPAKNHIGMTDMTDKSLFIEENIINSLKSLLSGRVNELLGETEYPIPPIEFGSYRGGSFTAPVISLSTCERSEKERIVRLDAYTLAIAFTVPEWPGGERNCYAYAASVAMALGENPTLGGVASRAELAGKKYSPPKQNGIGGEWEVELKIRVLVEEVVA